MTDKINDLNAELDTLNLKLKDFNDRRSRIISEMNKLEEEIFRLIEDKKNETNYQIWKEMEGKYYHVWFFTVPEEEKFLRCHYYHILKVEKNFLEYEYINIDNKSNCNFITITHFDFCHERGYRAWTEIHKNEYERIIKITKGLERLEDKKENEND